MGDNPRSSVWASLLALCIAAAASGIGCRTGKPAKIPENTAKSLELLAEDPRRDELAEGEDGEAQEAQSAGLPPATEPTRYDPCGIPLAVSIEAMISPKAIAGIQEALIEKGLLAQDTYNDGELESSTLAAIIALQKQADLPPVGLPTYSTVEALGLDPRLIFTTGDPNCEEGA